jgi:hypothetical protein
MEGEPTARHTRQLQLQGAATVDPGLLMCACLEVLM